MKIVARCIYYKAVTPSCDIIDMDSDTWREFLYADNKRRIAIVLQLLGKEYWDVREVAWIPLADQDKVVENNVT